MAQLSPLFAYIMYKFYFLLSQKIFLFLFFLMGSALAEERRGMMPVSLKIISSCTIIKENKNPNKFHVSCPSKNDYLIEKTSPFHHLAHKNSVNQKTSEIYQITF